MDPPPSLTTIRGIISRHWYYGDTTLLSRLITRSLDYLNKPFAKRNVIECSNYIWGLGEFQMSL